MKSKLTFCIPTHNNLEYLKLCIKSIKENATYKDAPIIVYAEGCTDGTNEWLTGRDLLSYEVDAHIHPKDNWNPKYWGIGGGMNYCADQVKTEYIFFLHSDMYIGPGADEAMMVHLNNCFESDKCVVSAHRIEPDIFKHGAQVVEPLRPGTLIAPIGAFGHLHSNFEVETFNEFAKDFTAENSFTVRKGEGAGGFMISKKAWDEIGGNDSSFAPKSYEDMDLFIRMQMEGYHFVLTSKAMIWHFGARSSHFPTDDFNVKAKLQSDSEAKNAQIWHSKWERGVHHDSVGFVSADGYEARYEELKSKDLHNNFMGYAG